MGFAIHGHESDMDVHVFPILTLEAVKGFLFLGSKVTVDNDCSHELKRQLLLGRKAKTDLDSVLKSTDITWSTKVLIVKAMVFAVVRYLYENWTIK